jgi:hypothetical protein
MRLDVFLHFETHFTCDYLAEKGVVDQLLHIFALATAQAALVATSGAVLEEGD